MEIDYHIKKYLAQALMKILIWLQKEEGSKFQNLEIPNWPKSIPIQPASRNKNLLLALQAMSGRMTSIVLVPTLFLNIEPRVEGLSIEVPERILLIFSSRCLLLYQALGSTTSLQILEFMGVMATIRVWMLLSTELMINKNEYIEDSLSIYKRSISTF